MLTAIAASIIKLTLFASVCSAPCTMRAVLELSPVVKEGQIVCIKLEDDYIRISCWPHRGEKIQDFQIKDIPAGTYTVEAAVVQGRDTATLEVR